MICNKCGVKNRDTSKRCFYCGAPLNKKKPVPPVIEEIKEDLTAQPEAPEVIEAYEILEEVEPISEVTKDVIIDEVVVEAITPEDDIVEVEEVTEAEEIVEAEEITEVEEETEVEESAETDEAVEVEEVTETEETSDVEDATEEDDVAEEENSNDVVIVDSEETEEPSDSEEVTAEEEAEESEEESATDSVVVEDGSEDNEETEEEASKKPIKKKLLMLLIAFIIVIIFAVVGYFVYKNYIQNQNTTTSEPADAITELNINAPEIKVETDSDGKEFINAKFYGQVNDILTLKCNNKTYTFTSDTLELKLYIEDVFPADKVFTKNTAEVNLQAYYTRDNEYFCKTDIMTFNLVAVNTDLTSNTEEVIISANLYNINFWVDSTATVTINDEVIAPNEFGIINHQVSPESGASYVINVTEPYKQQISKQIKFIEDTTPFNFKVSSEIADVHSEKTVTLTYSVDHGPMIGANLPVVSTEFNAETNTHTITLDISGCKYGVVNIALYAIKDDVTAKRVVSFKYWPSMDALNVNTEEFTKESLSTLSSDKHYTFNKVVFTEAVDKYKLKALVDDCEVIFDIYDAVDEIQLNTEYNLITQLSEHPENSAPIFKLWYASDPTISEDVFDEAVAPADENVTTDTPTA